MDAIASFPVTRFNLQTCKVEEISDRVVSEIPLRIMINETSYATIFCTPTSLRELVAGHLLSEGLVDSFREITSVEIDESLQCRVTIASEKSIQEKLAMITPFTRIITSGCGAEIPWPFTKLKDRLGFRKVTSKLETTARCILDAVRNLNAKASIYRQTGGVHASALYSKDGVELAFAEDVGRHNAMDKVIGVCAERDCEFGETFAVSTGRLSGDIVLKIARVGIPIVASISSVLSSGVEIAEYTGVTLIGFVRGNRMNVYNYPGRVRV